jgi:hypothetical protein
MAGALACQQASESHLVVRVVSKGQPVPGVTIILRCGPQQAAIDSAATDAAGEARLDCSARERVTVEALVTGDERFGFVSREHSPALDGSTLELELERDLHFGAMIRAFPRSSGAGDDVSGYRIAYGLPERAEDRQVTAILEIDRIAGLARPSLTVETSAGPLHLADILSAVGIRLDVVWSDEVAAAELGPDTWPGEQRLQEIMRRHRNIEVAPQLWHLYLLLAPQPEPGLELSLLIDADTRTGAVVFLPASTEHPGALIHAVAHEIGHMLNLAHPWEEYGNTRSVMSYPWRWSDWSWLEPQVYHFDSVGAHHLRRGPEPYVRPGGSRFLDRGVPVSEDR